MTRATEKPVRRLVSGGRHGELVVEVTEHYLVLREKGRRTRYAMPWGAAYVRAAQDKADADRRARKQRRGR